MTDPVKSQNDPTATTKPPATMSDFAAKLKATQTDAAHVAADKASPITQPKKLSPAHVLFRSGRENLGASTPTGIVRFINHYAQTDDPVQIKVLKDSAAHFGITVV